MTMWRYMKQRRVLATGSSSCMADVTGQYYTMAEASAAWGVHYGRRLQSDCQRRNRLLSEAVQATAAEITELFAELDITTRRGFTSCAWQWLMRLATCGMVLSAMQWHTQSRLSGACMAGEQHGHNTPAGTSAHGCL